MSNRVDVLTIKLETQGDGSVRASLAGVSKESSETAKNVDKLNSELAELKDRADPAGRSLRQLTKDKETLNRAVKEGLITQGQANTSLAQLDRQYRSTAGGAALYARAIGAIGVASLIQGVIRTNVEFERLGKVLVTLEGSQDGANRRMRELQEIAKETPSQLQEIVQAYATLKARGLDPSREAILAYANVAAASGKSTRDFIEAVADAVTGENERLKEFGIVARQAGDDVAFTFQGTTTVVEKNAGAIEKYLQNIGKVEFAGAAAAQMDTIGGAASNLQDELSELAVTIGDSGLRGELKELVATLAEGTSGLNEFLKALNRREGVPGFVGMMEQIHKAMSIQGIANGDIFNVLEREAEIRKVTAAQQEQASVLDLLKQKYSEAAGFIGGAYSTAMNGASEARAKATKETEKLLEKLREEAATHGLSKSAVLEHEKAQALANATTAKQREELTKLYDSLIKKTRAEEADSKAKKQSTKDDAEAARAKEKLRREIDEQVKAAHRLLETYEPAARMAREYAEAEKALDVAVKQGTMTTQKRAEILANLRFDQVIEQVRLLGREFKTVAASLSFNESEMRDLGQRGASSFLDAFTDVLMGADLSDTGRRLLQSMFGDSARTTLEQMFGRPMQQAIGNGSGAWAGIAQAFQGRSYESAPDFVGPPSTLAGQGNSGAGTMGQAGQLIGGALQVYDTYRNGEGGGGGALQGAAAGAQAGMVFGPWGALIGGIIGALAGYFGGGDPRIRVSNSESDARFTSQLGSGGVARDNMEPGSATRFAEGITAFDNAIAGMLLTLEDGPQKINAAREALANFSADVSGDAATVEEVLSRRFNAIVAAIEPGWQRLLSNIDDLQERVKAFEALFQIQSQVESLTETIDGLTGTPLQRLRTQLHNLDEAVTTTAAALASAIESQDPVRIREASAAAEQAVMRRFVAEIDMARTLEAALLSAQAAARATEVALTQRIQATGGASGLVAGVAQGNITSLRARVGAETNPERALQFLSEFVGSVDTWLNASIADVQQIANAERDRAQAALAGIAAQRATITQALQSLGEERDQIHAAAKERADNARRAIDEQMRAQAEANRARIEGLQAELNLAQQFRALVEQAEAQLKEMQFGSTNPLGGFARLSLIGNSIDTAESRFGSASAADKAEAGQELLALLQQRIGLVQQEGLLQRPSDEYLALYNETVRRISQVRDAAKPEADRALELQELLNDLQRETTQAIRDLGEQDLQFTAAEQARLDEIAKEEAVHQLELRVLARSEVALQQLLVDIQSHADAQIAELNATARAQYEWALGEGRRLEELRQATILEQLNELTGGRPVDEFIAARTAEAATLLTEIRDDLREFLETISSEGFVPNSQQPGTSPGGGGALPIDSTAPKNDSLVFAPTIHINGGGDAAQVARVVRDTLRAELPTFASQIKRDSKYA